MKKFAFYASIALVLISVTFIASYLLFIWNSYPKGWDAISHIFRIDFLRIFGPQTVWVFSWASGMPLFFLYPVLPYQTMSIISSLTNQPTDLILTLAAVFSIGLSAFFLFLFIRQLTTSNLLAFSASILFITNPSTWGMAFSSGLYPRALAAPFLVASLWSANRLLRNQNKLNLVFTALFVSLTLLAHFFVGIGTLILILAMILLGSSDWRKRLTLMISLISISLLLTAYFFLPFIWARRYAPGIPITKDSIFESQIQFSGFSDFFYLFKEESRLLTTQPSNFIPNLLVLHPILTPLLIVMSIVFLLSKAWKNIRDRAGTLLLFFVFSLACYLYSIFYFKHLLVLYGGVLAPKWALYIMPFFIIPSISLLSYAVLNKTIYSKIYAIAITSLSIIWFLLQFPFDKPFPRIIPYVERGVLGYSLLTRNLNRNESNFRFGDANIAEIASWFNIEFPYVPQTRDYYNQGIVNPDYYFYLYYAGWETDKNWLETNFLFNWFGIKDFVVDKSSKIYGKFANKESYYSLLDQDGNVGLYLFKSFSPILSARSTPGALTIGDKDGYNSVFRSLAFADINSDKIIPVEGKSKLIDDYSLSELSSFPIVILYNNYSSKNKKNVDRLLNNYVQNGGTLFVESTYGDNQVLTDILTAERKGISKWDMRGGGFKEVKIDPTGFSRPLYKGGDWKVFELTGNIDNSEVLLYQSGRPILIAKSIGKGKVIWSGMNLPFHIVNNNSFYESNLFGELLLLATSKAYGLDKFTPEFVGPQKRILTLNSDSKGVLFKEAAFPNWQASVNGKEAKIYSAGPGFMYLPLKDGKAGDVIVFEFGIHPVQWAGNLVSVITFLGLILYLFDSRIFKPHVVGVKQRLLSPFKQVSRWWGSEEE